MVQSAQPLASPHSLSSSSTLMATAKAERPREKKGMEDGEEEEERGDFFFLALLLLHSQFSPFLEGERLLLLSF